MPITVQFGSSIRVVDTTDQSLSMAEDNSNLGIEVTQTNPGFINKTQLIDNVTHEAVDLGDLTVPGRYMIINPKSNSFDLLLGIDVAAVFHQTDRIPPGQHRTGAIGAGSDPMFAKTDPDPSASAPQTITVKIAEK